MRKVFLDCGAHAGISVIKFREEYPKSDEYEIISFECNPRFTETLQKMDGIVFHNKAAWIEDGIQNFYIPAWYFLLIQRNYFYSENLKS